MVLRHWNRIKSKDKKIMSEWASRGHRYERYVSVCRKKTKELLGNQGLNL